MANQRFGVDVDLQNQTLLNANATTPATADNSPSVANTAWVRLQNFLSGIVGIANGGTGVASLPSGLLKGAGTGAITAASAGTDYGPSTAGFTGIVKSTSGTGAHTAAIAADFPTLNQNTSGTAAGLSAVLSGASGGTGVANSGKTITLGGNLTTSGAFTTTFTLTGNTALTLPTSGTLATTASNITGTSANVTGTVGIANGGTGATSAAAALTALGGVGAASPTFSGTVSLAALGTFKLVGTDINTAQFDWVINHGGPSQDAQLLFYNPQSALSIFGFSKLGEFFLQGPVNNITLSAGANNLLMAGGYALARLDSPAFLNSPTAPTPTAGTNNTRLATTAFVQAALAGGASVPVASATVAGISKVGTTLNIDGNGVLNANGPGIGVLYPGPGSNTDGPMSQLATSNRAVGAAKMLDDVVVNPATSFSQPLGMYEMTMVLNTSYTFSAAYGQYSYGLAIYNPAAGVPIGSMITLRLHHDAPSPLQIYLRGPQSNPNLITQLYVKMQPGEVLNAVALISRAGDTGGTGTISWVVTSRTKDREATGDLSTLRTSQLGDLVSAINELANRAPITLALQNDVTIASVPLLSVTPLKYMIDSFSKLAVYTFTYYIRYTSSVAATGIRASVNYTGTSNSFVANMRWVDASATAATANPSQANTQSAGAVVGAFSARGPSKLGWGTTLSVDSAGSNMLLIIEGVFQAYAQGDLELWMGCETTGATLTVGFTSSLVLQRTYSYF